MVGCELPQLGRRLCIEIRELLAVRAHACPKIADWIANEALRHRRVPLGFGRVTIRELGHPWCGCGNAHREAKKSPVHLHNSVTGRLPSEL
jgi:hypothetical protein